MSRPGVSGTARMEVIWSYFDKDYCNKLACKDRLCMLYSRDEMQELLYIDGKKCTLNLHKSLCYANSEYILVS